MSWVYEGIECYVRESAGTGYTPLYRAWNGRDHFYTVSKSEYDGLPSQYHREGISCYIASSPKPLHVPLFRLYKGPDDDHFYCTSTGERDNAVSNLGYTLEGVIGYVMPTDAVNHRALYRAWNPEIGDHFYTMEVSEIDKNGPTLTSSEMEGLLKDKLDKYLDGAKIYLADSNYFCPTERVAGEIIDACQVDLRRYISEVHDCDDFAHLLKSAFIEDAYDSGRRSMPYAVGIVWGRRPAHAMNVLAIGDGAKFHVKLIEPQTGTIHALSDDKLKEIYLVVM